MINKCPSNWADTLAQNTAQAEIPLVVGLIVIALVVKFNRHESKNEANAFLFKCLGIGFLALVAFRIFRGLFPSLVY